MFAKFVSEIGTAHLAVQICDKMIHWYDSGLVLIQGYEGSNATAVFYPQNLSGEVVPVIENTPEMRQKICEVIQKFNCEKTYDLKRTNCQHFAQEVFKVLDLQSEFSKMEGPVGNYLNYIIGKGRNSSKHCFLVNKDLIIVKDNAKKDLCWDNHEQLDQWTTTENQKKYELYAPLLKAFHRGFQMREKALVKRGIETYKGDDEHCPLGWPTMYMKNLMEKFGIKDDKYDFFDIETSTSFKVTSGITSGITSGGLSSNKN